MRNSRRLGLVISAAMLLLLSRGAHGQNLIVNGGFETGDFTGWGITVPDNRLLVGADNPHSGTYAAEFGSSFINRIYQSFPTIIGDPYQISWWFDQPVPLGNYNYYDVAWQGDRAAQDLFDQTGVPPTNGYVEFTSDETATTTSTELTFTETQNGGFSQLDDVSVTLVPEPASASLVFLSGLGLLLRPRPRRNLR